MRLNIDNIIDISSHIKHVLTPIILEGFRNNIKKSTDTSDKIMFSVGNNDHYLLFKTNMLVKAEEYEIVNEALAMPVYEIECEFNGHSLNSIYLTREDLNNDLDGIAEVVPLFLCSEILKLCFRKWYEPNIMTPSAGASLPSYDKFLKSILNPLGYSTSLSWDGKMFNFTIFAETDEYEVITQINSYTKDSYLMQEETYLSMIKIVVHDVLLDLFRTKKFNSNLSIEL